MWISEFFEELLRSCVRHFLDEVEKDFENDGKNNVLRDSFEIIFGWFVDMRCL